MCIRRTYNIIWNFSTEMKRILYYATACLPFIQPRRINFVLLLLLLLLLLFRNSYSLTHSLALSLHTLYSNPSQKHCASVPCCIWTKFSFYVLVYFSLVRYNQSTGIKDNINMKKYLFKSPLMNYKINLFIIFFFKLIHFCIIMLVIFCMQKK